MTGVWALRGVAAEPCRCGDGAIRNGEDCEKCGKPLERPVIDAPRPTATELERRDKIAAYWRGRRHEVAR